jgi:predicted kinase
MLLSSIAGKISKQIIAGKLKTTHPKVLVLMGLEYSGKSYLADHIASHNYAHFWATKIKKDYDIVNEQMLDIAKKVLALTVSAGFNVVLDYTNHKRAIRGDFQKIAEQLGADYLLVFLDTPKSERLRRRALNVQKGDMPGRRVISLEDMKKLEHEFEVPQADEPSLSLKDSIAVESFIKSLN